MPHSNPAPAVVSVPVDSTPRRPRRGRRTRGQGPSRRRCRRRLPAADAGIRWRAPRAARQAAQAPGYRRRVPARQRGFPPGHPAPPLHVHPHTDEAFDVADGDATFQLGDRELPVTAGGLVFVPWGTAHTVWAGDRSVPGRILPSPGGAEHLFVSVEADQRHRCCSVHVPTGRVAPGYGDARNPKGAGEDRAGSSILAVTRRPSKAKWRLELRCGRVGL
jgi:mannose-6-phosphate isomerase-like protein (cupin superfamily)